MPVEVVDDLAASVRTKTMGEGAITDSQRATLDASACLQLPIPLSSQEWDELIQINSPSSHRVSRAHRRYHKGQTDPASRFHSILSEKGRRTADSSAG